MPEDPTENERDDASPEVPLGEDDETVMNPSRPEPGAGEASTSASSDDAEVSVSTSESDDDDVDADVSVSEIEVDDFEEEEPAPPNFADTEAAVLGKPAPRPGSSADLSGLRASHAGSAPEGASPAFRPNPPPVPPPRMGSSADLSAFRPNPPPVPPPRAGSSADLSAFSPSAARAGSSADLSGFRPSPDPAAPHAGSAPEDASPAPDPMRSSSADLSAFRPSQLEPTPRMGSSADLSGLRASHADFAPDARPSQLPPPPAPPRPGSSAELSGLRALHAGSAPDGASPAFRVGTSPGRASQLPPSSTNLAAARPSQLPSASVPIIDMTPAPEPVKPRGRGPQEVYGSTGVSQLPPAPVDKLEAIAAAVSRLRSEVDATTDKARRGRLLVEAAEIQESGGDESGAARDYLQSYNSDTSFREPLEGLVRLLERRRSLSNVGKLIEQLVAAASTPEERARALTQRAIFFEDVQKDLEGARGMAREATETAAIPAELGPAWLTLEMVTAKLGDAAQREEALAGRAELTENPTWRGLLLIDVARLAAAAGETDRAVEILIVAREEGGQAAFRALGTTARLLRSDPGLPGSGDARSRSRILAETLEALAELIKKTMPGDRPSDEGVPLWCRTTPHVTDLLLCAADARVNAGDLAGAARVLDRALAVLEDAAPRHDESTASTEVHREISAGIGRIVIAERMRLAEHMGDSALAAELAERRMVGETDGGFAAALCLRIAEHAAGEGDVPRALAALKRAAERDPTCAPARALAIDLLESSDDSAGFAEELEELSRHCVNGEAQGRALLLAAYVWATRAEDAGRAREALGQAEACGAVARDVIARLGRSLAALRNDPAWYEDATRMLVEHLASERTSAELPLLWIELARLRLAQGDEAGAAKATAALRDLPEGAWIGRALDALASGEDPARARAALEELTAEVGDPELRRSLGLVCALRARAAGDETSAIAHLETLAKDDPSDVLVAAYLGDLFRLAGERSSAARIASTTADALAADPEAAAARHLEAGFEKWRLGDRSGAVASFESAANTAPAAARPALAWSARGIEVDTVEGRRRAIALATRSGEPDGATALERFALEAALGDPDEAGTSIAIAGADENESIKLAAALGWLAWPKGTTDPEAVSAALDVLASKSPKAKAAAAAERLRLAREGGGDVAASAQAWIEAGGGLPAAMEWLAAAMASGEPEAEIPARRALAEVTTDEHREALNASATMFANVLRPDVAHPLIGGSSPAALLVNLELAPPGSDPRRRATVLSDLDGALGDESEIDAMGLAGWSALAAGEPAAALDVFRAVTAVRPGDLHAWEGLRAAAEELGDHEAYAHACEELGARCVDPARGAAFWEQAALTWLRLKEAASPAFDAKVEPALDASFLRDPTRAVAFDRLFRRVRDRKNGDKLLDLIERRLGVTDDATEIAKLYWEQARVLREKGDPDAALEALEHVTDFDDNHVGALALTGEIFIKRGMFAEAAQKLARLAKVEVAPPKNRVTAGVAAVDLYENKLQRPEDALEVLTELHRAGLTTLPVRERMARTAARTGAWDKATSILEELMMERPERDGRIEAARLAMAIHRDRLLAPSNAIKAAAKLLEESPGDVEALELVVGLDASIRERRMLLERSRDTLLMGLHQHPVDADADRRLARVARAIGDNALEQAALSSAIALAGPDGTSEQMVAMYSSRKPRLPQVSLTDPMIRQILAPGDEGPIADLFVALGPTIGEALGPSRDSVGVSKKDRVDPRSGTPLRTEIAAWAGAFGIPQFELYIGGVDATGVQAIAGETPAIVCGANVTAPLSTTTRARLARELMGLARGTSIVRHRDDATIGAIVTSVCNLLKVRVESPAYATLAETQRAIDKAISRRTKAAIEPILRNYIAAGTPDPRAWAARARSSQARAGLLASGDVVLVLVDLFSENVNALPSLVANDPRAHELLRFILSRPYFDLRRGLGLEAQ